jgi:DNA-directed RNA polymerase subunit RPC12/RpoP
MITKTIHCSNCSAKIENITKNFDSSDMKTLEHSFGWIYSDYNKFYCAACWNKRKKIETKK